MLVKRTTTYILEEAKKEVEAANKNADEARKDAEAAKKEAEATRNEVDEKIAANNKIWEEKFAQLLKDIATRVYSRLDRVLINGEWGDQMKDIYAHFLPEGNFDHTPCIVKSSIQSMHHMKPFKYYNMWGKHSHYINNLSSWWKTYVKGTKMFCLVSKLKQLKSKFRNYNKEYLCDIENSSMMALKNLEYIQTQLALNPRDTYWYDKEIEAITEYKELQEACTNFLRQKAKVISIKDINGLQHYDPQKIQEAFLQYYIQLLGTEINTVSVNEKIIRTCTVCSADHVFTLLKPVTYKEIKASIFSIPGHKAPDPDGYSSAFYKDSWSIIGDEVYAAIQDVF
ncbi:uncharacterized protein LOC141616997 [Silene latifolia]|uniref:uncharacterized protein LOC141616997 n=1 Tax=Silene latifolia TaxID=37657 RepID=UPI003D77C8C5